MPKLANLCRGLGIVISLGLPAAAQETAPQQDVTVDTVVASVNGIDITVGHVAIARAALDERFKQYPADVLFNGLREQLIQQTLLMQSLNTMPRQLEILIENQRREMIAGEAVGLVADAAVTEEAIQEAYDEAFASAAPSKEYNASHILLETEEAALAALDRAQAGEEFADLARELSTGPSGPNGGSLGWFELDRMVAPFGEAVAAMEVGAVSGPVQTEFGFHVIMLNDRRDVAVPPLEEVREVIIRNLERAAAEEHVKALVDGAEIVKVDGIDPAIIMDRQLFIE